MTVARDVLAATATGSNVMANLATGLTRISDAHSVASSPCSRQSTLTFYSVQTLPPISDFLCQWHVLWLFFSTKSSILCKSGFFPALLEVARPPRTHSKHL